MAITHNLGFPRIGAKRELKFALEAYWKGQSPAMIYKQRPQICGNVIGRNSQSWILFLSATFHFTTMCWI